MLKRKVVASQVTNLTDARYFAARGIDYLLFDLDQVSLDKIIEINEWVEGPELLLLFSNQSLSSLDESIIKLSPLGIGAKTSEVEAEISHLSTHAIIFQWTDKQLKLDDLLFKEISFITEIQSLKDNEGLLISGGDEKKVGIKAYDDLDEILDALED